MVGRLRWKRAVLPSMLLAGAVAVSACQPAKTSEAPAARPVRVAVVRLEPAEDVIRYAAVIRPRVEADIGARIAGKVVERRVDVGARVEAGTPLARLDPADLELQVRAASAQLAAANADAANARAEFQRYGRLRQGDWTTQQEYDRRKAALDKAEAHVREVEAQRRVVENNLQYTTLVADGPGIVTAVLVEPGQVVGQGQPAFRIARLGDLEAVASIPEQQVKDLSVPFPADSDRPAPDLSVEIWSLPGVVIPGRLRELAPNADPGTRTFQARVALVDPPPAVRLGMTATLVSRRVGAQPVARLPLTALTQRTGDAAVEPAVWVVAESGDHLALRPVDVAAYAGDQAIIADGLADGERVVTAGVHKLDAGQRVRVWTEPVR